MLSPPNMLQVLLFVHVLHDVSFHLRNNTLHVNRDAKPASRAAMIVDIVVEVRGVLIPDQLHIAISDAVVPCMLFNRGTRGSLS